MGKRNGKGIEISERIYALCKAKGLPIGRLEDDLGLSHSYIRRIKLQDSMPAASRLNAIAAYLSVSPEFLMGETDKRTASGGIRIPLLGRVAAGYPITAAENVIGEEEISQRDAARGEFFALLIKGDSMSPDIKDGDKVIVRQQEDAENGQIVIALINGEDGVCKELRKVASGLMLVSRNPNYEPMVFTHADIDTIPVRIIGRVVEVRREL